MPRVWYYYVGSDGEEDQLNKYIRASGPFRPCPSGTHLCAIYARNGAINPSDISLNMLTYIILCKSLGTPQPDTPPGAKRYVYCRTQ